MQASGARDGVHSLQSTSEISWLPQTEALRDRVYGFGVWCLGGFPAVVVNTFGDDKQASKERSPGVPASDGIVEALCHLVSY